MSMQQQPFFPESAHSLASDGAHGHLLRWEWVQGRRAYAVRVLDAGGVLRATGTGEATKTKTLDKKFQLWAWARVARGESLWFHPQVQPDSTPEQLRAVQRSKACRPRRAPRTVPVPTPAPELTPLLALDSQLTEMDLAHLEEQQVPAAGEPWPVDVTFADMVDRPPMDDAQLGAWAAECACLVYTGAWQSEAHIV